jgi:RluA family pseudouridine synthase
MIEDLLLYEDTAVLAFNKPSGMHSTPGKSGVDSLAHLIAHAWPDQQHVSPNAAEAGLLQRLDYETSGCVLVARSREVWELLHEHLTSGNAQKSYLLLTEGLLNDGEVHTLIGSRHRGSKKVSVHPLSKKASRTQEAKTHFQLVSQPIEHLSLARATTATGRRHQVRAHAAYHGHPLVGDSLYGAQQALQQYAIALGTTKVPPFFLHAESIVFRHPTSLNEVQINAPVPDYAHALIG